MELFGKDKNQVSMENGKEKKEGVKVGNEVFASVG